MQMFVDGVLVGQAPIFFEDAYAPYVGRDIKIVDRDALKAARQVAVDNIKVTVNGKVFDGDETSQTRMTRAIIGLQATSQESITWVLADNTATQATLAELTEALCLAGAAQAAIWVI